MKVTFRTALVVLLAAAIMLQTASATSLAVMRRGVYYVPETTKANVARDITTGANVSETFAEIRPALEAAVEPDVRCRTWEDVTVCSPTVGDDPIHRYADPSFWTITGSPVQNLDFLLSDRTHGDTGNEISRLALDSTSMAEQQCIVKSEHKYSSGRFRLANGAGGTIGFVSADCGTGF